jgi:hypothetical protein
MGLYGGEGSTDSCALLAGVRIREGGVASSGSVNLIGECGEDATRLMMLERESVSKVDWNCMFLSTKDRNALLRRIKLVAIGSIPESVKDSKRTTTVPDLIKTRSIDRANCDFASWLARDKVYQAEANLHRG